MNCKLTNCKITPELIDCLKRNTKVMKNKELAELVNSLFGVNYSIYQISKIKVKCGIKGSPRGPYEIPLYSEFIHKSNGIFIKVISNGRIKWVKKARWMWEQVHGKIKRGDNIIFLDKNPLNVDIKNLYLVSKAELAILQKKKLISNNPEITKIGILMARHRIAINERITEGMEKEQGRKTIHNMRCREFNKRKKITVNAQKQAK